MGEKEILEDTTRTTGREALKKNVQAAIALSGAIRSTLGPKGLDKLLIDDDGRTLVTNDGVTVLETAKVEHPVAKMVIGASSLQDKIAKDGTTSTVILASEMLRNAWELVVQGIHPAVIGRGFRMAEQKVIKEIDNLSLEGNEKLFKKAVVSALSGKGHDSLKDIVSELSLKAVGMISNDGQKIANQSPTNAVILGCAGMTNIWSKLQPEHQITLIDPVAAAARLVPVLT